MPLWQQRRIHAQSIWLRGRQFKIPMPNMIEHTPPTPLNTNTKQKKNPHTPLRSFVRSISRTAAHTNTFVPLYIQSAIKLASITLIIQANGTWFWYAICSIWIFDPPASTRRRSVGYTPPRRCVSRRLDGLALLSAANTGWLAGGHHYLSLFFARLMARPHTFVGCQLDHRSRTLRLATKCTTITHTHTQNTGTTNTFHRRH